MCWEPSKAWYVDLTPKHASRELPGGRTLLGALQELLGGRSRACYCYAAADALAHLARSGDDSEDARPAQQEPASLVFRV